MSETIRSDSALGPILQQYYEQLETYLRSPSGLGNIWIRIDDDTLNENDRWLFEKILTDEVVKSLRFKQIDILGMELDDAKSEL